MFNVHTTIPGIVIPEGYFNEDNISFIQQKIINLLYVEYQQKILVSHSDIIRVMERVLYERRENVPLMNQRTVMYIVNDFRTHQIEVNRNYNWGEGFVQSQRLIDPVGETMKFDYRGIKTNDQKKWNGQSKLGGTLRFHHT